jgi:hypothetical protein
MRLPEQSPRPARLPHAEQRVPSIGVGPPWLSRYILRSRASAPRPQSCGRPDSWPWHAVWTHPEMTGAFPANQDSRRARSRVMKGCRLEAKRTPASPQAAQALASPQPQLKRWRHHSQSSSAGVNTAKAHALPSPQPQLTPCRHQSHSSCPAVTKATAHALPSPRRKLKRWRTRGGIDP